MELRIWKVARVVVACLLLAACMPGNAQPQAMPTQMVGREYEALIATKQLSSKGTLGVTGLASLDGGLAMDTNKFTVADTSGNTVIAGTLNVSGLSTLGALTLSGALSPGAGLSTSNGVTVTGHITASKLTVSGATALNGATTANGGLSSSNGVTVTGHLTTTKITVSGASALNGATALDGGATANGGLSSSNGVTVTGHITTSKLTVSGASALNGATTLGGVVTLQGGETIDNSLDNVITLTIGTQEYSILPNQFNMSGHLLRLDADSDSGIAATTDNELRFMVNGSDYMSMTASGLYVGALYNLMPVLVKTADYSLTPMERGAVVVNTGASSSLTITLPSAAAGLYYCIGISAAQILTVNVTSGDAILGLTNAANNRIMNAGTVGDSVCLSAIDATNWLPIGAARGTWTDVD
jgi:hypothetical protein